MCGKLAQLPDGWSESSRVVECAGNFLVGYGPISTSLWTYASLARPIPGAPEPRRTSPQRWNHNLSGRAQKPVSSMSGPKLGTGPFDSGACAFRCEPL